MGWEEGGIAKSPVPLECEVAENAAYLDNQRYVR